jgi:catalase
MGGPQQDPSFAEPPLKISGDAARYDHRAGNDDYGQPRALWALFDPTHKQRLYENISTTMRGVPSPIRRARLGALHPHPPRLRAGIRAALAGRTEPTVGLAGAAEAEAAKV